MNAQSLPSIQEQINALVATLAIPGLDAQTRASLETRLLQLQAQLDQSAGLIVVAPSAGRDLNIATQQTISYITTTYLTANTPDKVTLLAEYLGRLGGDCNRLSLADADSSDPTRRAVELAQVYTRLEVASTVELKDDEQRRSGGIGERQRQLTALEAVAANRRLVLLGEPGSGKSTFVNFLALCLAQAAQGNTKWLAQLGEGWTRAALLPVRVVLREFGAWIDARPQRPVRGDALLLWAFLAQQHGKEVVPILRQEVAAGRALLLLDGLDEVQADQQAFPLTIVMATIQSLAATAARSTVLLTCRVLDYEQDQRRQFPHWPGERLIPLSQDLRKEFIARWYAALGRLQRQLNADPALLRDRLQAEVAGRPELRRLAGNPLLLTMMTLIHAYEGRLPDQRVKLYAECIRFLLHRWRARPGEQPLRVLLELPDWSESDVESLLDRLGFAAHERGVGTDGEAGADLPRPVLIETARSFFARYDADRSYARAEAFCGYIKRYGNGVLQQHSQDTYRFPHRTFQEYLAARRLASEGDWPEGESDFVMRGLRRAAAGPQWREALLLAVSQMVVVGKQMTLPVNLADELRRRFALDSADHATNAILAGELLHEIGSANLLSLGAHRQQLWDDTRAALVQILEAVDPNGRARLPVETRVRAGQALGLLGDPRVPVTSDEWRVTSVAFAARDEAGTAGGADRYLRPYWREVPAGSFLMGSTDEQAVWDDEKPQHEVSLASFHIARYPITNAQWKQFVDEEGYQDRRWWSEAGWAYIEPGGRRDEGEPERITQPRYWHSLRFNGPNQPVVSVSWYEANAFCCWLTAQGHTEGWLANEQQIRLPSEAEWEKAARGVDGRIYPWGNEWDASKANTLEGAIGATTPVGCYSDGGSPYGVLDTSGNAQERTATPWTDNYSQDDGTQIEFSEGVSFVWRGGSWANNSRVARCASRDGDTPTMRGTALGLRLVAALGRVMSDE